MNFKIKKKKIDFKSEIEPQEIFLDSLAQKKEEELGISEKKFETPLSRNILKGFLIFTVILNLLLLLRTFQLQIIEGKNFTLLSERNKFTIHQIKAERGVIYDKQGKQLVWNKPSFDLVLNKNDLPKEEKEKIEILKKVANIIQKDIEDLKKEIEEKESSEILLLENISFETLILFETKIEDLTGFRIQKNIIRDYRFSALLSHLIGYSGKITREELNADPNFYTIFDWVGKMGLEAAYEEILRVNPGRLKMERDAKGNIISQEILSLPESGKSLVLWLDFELQEKIKKELEKSLKAVGAEKGVAVALDPKTGGVLALVSLPDFNNNLFQKGAVQKERLSLFEDPKKPLFNRVISGRYPVGSTIKPLIAAAALEEQIINPQKQIYSPGFIKVPHRYDPKIVYTYRDWTVHGWTDLRKAIAQSVNVYFYTIGGGYADQKGLGPTKIKQYLELFGWGEKTGIDLPEEKKGFIPDPQWKREVLKEDWWDGNTYHFSIGQGYLQITPLEVVTSFVAIANGGKLLQPQVVKAIVDENKEIVEEFEPKIIRENFIEPANLQVVREGMRRAVSGENSPLASAVLLNSLPISSAAKTGTAELGGNRYHNWITVFAPYEDPEIVLTIMVENVKGLQRAVLFPAKEILEWYFTK